MVGDSHSAFDRYAKEARNLPQAHVCRADMRSSKNTCREPKDIVFTEADAKWVYHPHTKALVITVRMNNINVHRMLVNNDSAADILYWDAYKSTGLTENDFCLMTSPLYEFTGDHVIPKGTIKLVFTEGEHPKTSTVVTKFFDYPLAFNGVIGRPLLKALKAVTSIYYLTMKFPTKMGTGQV